MTIAYADDLSVVIFKIYTCCCLNTIIYLGEIFENRPVVWIKYLFTDKWDWYLLMRQQSEVPNSTFRNPIPEWYFYRHKKFYILSYLIFDKLAK